MLRKTINFSLWCDFIEKSFLQDDFQKMIDDKIVYGATSNPSIFESAICNSSSYSSQINMLQENEPKKIYEELAIHDIKKAATIMQNLYKEDESNGLISLEVDPKLCDDAKATIEEAIRLHSLIKYGNLMIKIPATNAGYEAMTKLTAMGINVNATLIFSPKQATMCAIALDEGLKQSQSNTQAVVSVFVSRVDKALQEKLKNSDIKYNTGIVNATMCYHEVNKINNPDIRTLFASTGTKSDELEKDYYISNLLFPNSVNTAPLEAIECFTKNKNKTKSEIMSYEDCQMYFQSLEKNFAVDLNEIYLELFTNGLSTFKTSFKNLLKKLQLKG
jgi:transaldolase